MVGLGTPTVNHEDWQISAQIGLEKYRKNIILGYHGITWRSVYLQYRLDITCRGLIACHLVGMSRDISIEEKNEETL